jgi:bifunctional non-homologous end joining protein LigD
MIEKLSPQAQEKIKKKAQPDWVEPMLARLTHDHFSDDKWIYERKLDGERCLAFLCNGDVDLLSRGRQNLNHVYPEIVEAFRNRDTPNLIADGEVVAFEGHVTSFARLQGRMHVADESEARNSRIAVYFYLFDLIYVEDHDLAGLDLRQRKVLLRQALRFRDPLRFLNHRNADGEAYLREACRKGWEGIIAKRADSRYAHGRSSKWLKFKCTHRQEFVIAGFTEPHGRRIGFGAILIGYYEGDRLLFAGKVGTGFDHETLDRLRGRFDRLQRQSCPFAGNCPPEKEVHWLSPKLVAEVGFTEWTADGKLRHPRFIGLRRDKDPHEVVRE